MCPPPRGWMVGEPRHDPVRAAHRRASHPQEISMSPHPSPRGCRVRTGVVATAIGATLLGGLGVADPAGAAPHAPQPRVKTSIVHGVLFVDGGRADDAITLRVPAVKPHLLEIDLGDDGTADASILRSRFDTIVVRGRAGNDTLKVDGTSAPFDEPVSLRGNAGNDTLLGGAAQRGPRRRPRRRHRRRQPGSRRATSVPATTPSSGTRATAATRSRARAGADTMRFNGFGRRTRPFHRLTPGDPAEVSPATWANIVMDA